MPTVTSPAQPKPLWFIANLARIHVDGETSDGKLAVVEALGARGDMPPLHVHTVEDETFYVLDGRLSVHVAGCEPIVLEAGEPALAAPRGARPLPPGPRPARRLAAATP